MPKPARATARSTKDIDVLIGERIREIRIEKGLSQAALGEAVGVSFQQIQKYERAANRISASTLFAICQFFDYPIDKIFERSKARKPHS
ncbi:helix-turn-helix transcriptional regulator [Tardiphaga sp. P9-11]|uniref:helix-turn-helix domain-containing protein n=1 Tax=Tardiphaga sp. P9-11 TaxID=2024614 RepID=UPI0011F1150C|nr:helix-turn-helix transcriptional regulator [Tardiphaga sp. P9-11]KAA0076105.1 XRE family transcriptional regulator [Tardiphaga sp. P9-11]